MKRLNYIDYLRGLAIVLMVINHVGHYLAVQPTFSYLIYLSIYLTVTLAAPIFLFVAGFSLAVKAKASADLKQDLAFGYFLKRGLFIILIGILINICYFGDAPWYYGRILLTIGAGVILAYPFLKYLKAERDLFWPATVFLSLIIIYPLTFGWWTELTAGQAVWTQIFFGEFSLYPWILLLLMGIVAGRYFLALKIEEQTALAKKIRLSGILLLAGWFFCSLMVGNGHLFGFGYDLNLNNYWLPADLTWLWIFSWLMILFSFFYRRNEQANWWLNNLSALGKNALFIYFVHFFIIKTVGHNWLNIQAEYFYQTVIADLFIIIILCWLVKSKAFARLMALNPLKARARIS